MAITKVTEGVRTLGTEEVLTANIKDGDVTTAKMATDPTNASNLSSGDVPLAQLGNVDTSGITANQYDIALLGFKVAANGSLARYNLVDQSIDAFEDASGVDASASTDETRNAAGKYYSGVATGVPTGDGTVTTHGVYTVHTFTADGDFIAPVAGSVDYLMVAGGGGGGGGNGIRTAAGGGGAGGVLTSTALAVTAATHAVVIGAGGAGATAFGSGTTGGDTTFNSLTADGGGGGGGYANIGKDGGSGGGGSGFQTKAGGAGTAGPPRQGYDGAGGNGAQNNTVFGGAGGGAGAVGTASQGGAGGIGIQNDYKTGSDIYYAGGGGGGSGQSTAPGGNGGGGAGGETEANGTSATDGLGGGGGGAVANTGYNFTGGDGGNGVVVLRFLTDGGFEAFNDMTLVSNVLTAESAPTNGDLVITYSDGVGTATINTDIKAYISRNGSAYTSAVTLVSQGTTGGHTILTANGVDLSGITTGTSMRWKIETLNQSESKDTRIQAVSLGWS